MVQSFPRVLYFPFIVGTLREAYMLPRPEPWTADQMTSHTPPAVSCSWSANSHLGKAIHKLLLISQIVAQKLLKKLLKSCINNPQSCFLGKEVAEPRLLFQSDNLCSQPDRYLFPDVEKSVGAWGQFHDTHISFKNQSGYLSPWGV